MSHIKYLQDFREIMLNHLCKGNARNKHKKSE